MKILKEKVFVEVQVDHRVDHRVLYYASRLWAAQIQKIVVLPSLLAQTNLCKIS